MKLANAEAHELLERLFTNDDAELLIGQPEGLVTTTWFVGLPKHGGGVTTKSLTPRSATLIAKLLDLAPVEAPATPAELEEPNEIFAAHNDPAPSGSDTEDDV